VAVVPDRREVERWDREDPLGRLREQFVIPDDRLVYLDGNSLGRPTRASVEAVRRALEEEWGAGLIGSWEREWLALPESVGDLIGTRLLGARPGEVVVADSTTVNLARLLRGAARARADRTVVVVEEDNFPTDHYLVQELAADEGMAVRVVPAHIDHGAAPEAMAAALDADVAVACFSHVAYRSGARADMAAVTAAAHAAGALVVWDLSHSAGALPVDLEGSGADLAVGCTYKYLNGGPGAPAFLYVRASLQDRLAVPVWGWFAQQDRFEMATPFLRRPGIGGFVVGTPPVLALRSVEASVGVLAGAGLEALGRKSRRLSELAVALLDAWLAPLGAALASPRPASRRGSHLTVAHPRARELRAALARSGIVTDYRSPERLRLGLAPATTRFTDVWDVFAALRQLCAR